MSKLSDEFRSKRDKDIIENLSQAILELGKDVSIDGYDKWPGRMSASRTIRGRFGWQNAKELAMQLLTDESKCPAPKNADMDWKQWLKFAINSKNTLYQEAGFGSQIAEKEFKERRIALVFSSDWHLGSVSTNYDAFMRNIEFLLDTPNLYMVVVGDTIDNFLQFPDKSARLHQIINPMYQKKMLKSIIDELISRKKIIATGWGDHDSRFEEKLNGSDVIKTLTNNRIPYFPGKGVLKLKIGSQQYTCAVTHKSRFNSYMNETHSSSQEYRTFIPADICVTGHTHSPAYSVCHRLQVAREAGMGCGGQVILIRTGTYKSDDLFSIRYWNAGVIGTPTVVMYGDEWKLIPFSTAELAVEFMNGQKK
jgi:predicted phosphodiesterase